MRPRAYDWVVKLAHLLLRFFFRRVEVTGTEHVPEGGGGILVSWHPNGMIDPALIFETFPRQVVFGARHGLFGVPVLGHLMRAIGTVPIYRAMDTKKLDESARREANAKSLDALADRVAQGSFSCLFPEGDSHDEPHLLALKTGVARFYYRARELMPDGAPPPVIVPVGLHYDEKRLFRSSVLVTYHPPLALPDGLDVPPTRTSPRSSPASGSAR
ncbi:MAG: 1-acyl-sn-glycerol-3-phosphate acyltransferase [Sandaracinaceae bacterium]